MTLWRPTMRCTGTGRADRRNGRLPQTVRFTSPLPTAWRRPGRLSTSTAPATGWRPHCNGHEKVYFVIGRNKLAPTYDEALWRARNIAAPKNAQRLNKKTPCAVKADRCYDCRSPERICRGLVTLWGPMMGMPAEVLLVDEDLGL